MGEQEQSIISKRIQNIAAEINNNSLGALVLNASPTLNYLTGMEFHLSERPVLGIISSTGELRILLPELEQAKLRSFTQPHQAFTYGEDPADWPAAVQKAMEGVCANDAAVGVDDRNMRMLEMRLLFQAHPAELFQNAAEVTSAIRMKKDQSEIDAMQKAVVIAEKGFDMLLGQIEIGMTEVQIASMLTKNLYDCGSAPKLPFTPIIASGPENSANPHAFPTDRKIEDGDLIVIDWGAGYENYLSDITRTIAVGTPSDKQLEIYAIVKASNQAGREFAKPGVTCSQVDAASRKVIEDAGYGEYFIHRTGHGLGLEGHEDPYIRSGNDLVLEAGMSFTIEPGIYIPGMSGVRIEDDVVLTDDGLLSLSTYPRDLIRV